MEKLVSVIVPVFNVENFIDVCVESLIKQSYSNIEIILVDDGSTDSSAMLCDKWATVDTRIKVIHQANGGLSAARNTGLKHAAGEYICFVDSDDFVQEDYVKCMVDAIEDTGAEVAFCDVVTSRWPVLVSPITSNLILDAAECRRWLDNLISREYALMVVSWNKLYKKELFENNRFEEGRLHEDEFMINKLIFSIEKMVYVPLEEYVYRMNSSGITGKENEYNIAHLDAIDAYADRIDVSLENNDIGFAKNTLRNTLYKLADYYFKMEEHHHNTIKSKMRNVLDKYSEIVTTRQKFKYELFMISPAVFKLIFR